MEMPKGDERMTQQEVLKEKRFLIQGENRCKKRRGNEDITDKQSQNALFASFYYEKMLKKILWVEVERKL